MIVSVDRVGRHTMQLSVVKLMPTNKMLPYAEYLSHMLARLFGTSPLCCAIVSSDAYALLRVSFVFVCII